MSSFKVEPHLLLYPIILLSLPFVSKGAKPDIVINEVCWMGTENSHYDEWLELKNTGERRVDLEGWTLTSSRTSPRIELAGGIGGGEFFLLERTDDSTRPEVKADRIYTGSLSNRGEDLLLRNEKGEPVDEVKAGEGWPAGENITKQTMERGAEGWHASRNEGGTPKAKNTELPSPLKTDEEKAKILPETAWKRTADKRFLKTLFLGLSASLISASFALVMRRRIV